MRTNLFSSRVSARRYPKRSAIFPLVILLWGGFSSAAAAREAGGETTSPKSPPIILYPSGETIAEISIKSRSEERKDSDEVRLFFRIVVLSDEERGFLLQEMNQKEPRNSESDTKGSAIREETAQKRPMRVREPGDSAPWSSIEFEILSETDPERAVRLVLAGEADWAPVGDAQFGLAVVAGGAARVFLSDTPVGYFLVSESLPESALRSLVRSAKPREMIRSFFGARGRPPRSLASENIPSDTLPAGLRLRVNDGIRRLHPALLEHLVAEWRLAGIEVVAGKEDSGTENLPIVWIKREASPPLAKEPADTAGARGGTGEGEDTAAAENTTATAELIALHEAFLVSARVSRSDGIALFGLLPAVAESEGP
ncbi:MAG: hypothetical protein D6679_12535 [Candidatus Hydrogenedentota bacterium]|nr:MAG: hypothetical protein D6679_12535 [Candidatus Hydrogenedentota bacterium]